MKFAWLIAAHDRPEQLRALLDLLLDKTQDIAVLHLDAKSALWRDHRGALRLHPSGRVFLVESPVAVHWGRASQLIATKAMIDTALGHECDYLHHISGTDWPVVPRAQIAADIAADGGACAYLTVTGEQGAHRMEALWPDYPRLLGMAPACRLTDKLGGWLTRGTIRSAQLAARIGLRRAAPYGPWHKGWSWWSLPRDLAREASDVIGANAASGRLLLTTTPDEHLLPTYFHSRHRERLRDFRRFVKWRAEDVNNPELLRRDDLAEIAASNAWLARKFAMDEDDFFRTAFASYA